MICDRYYDSSLAYQGYGHGIPLETIRTVTALATDSLAPDLTLLLDIDPERGLRRRQTNGAEWNRLDDYDKDFHRRVYDGYQQLIAAEPDRWLVVNAAQQSEAVATELKNVVLGRLVESKR